MIYASGILTFLVAFVACMFIQIDANHRVPFLEGTIPSSFPTAASTPLPSVQPTRTPSRTPTKSPTFTPSVVPTTTVPSLTPTTTPSHVPSVIPSQIPTISPTISPTYIPTISPSYVPSTTPSQIPSVTPSASPSTHPTVEPTYIPSVIPTVTPSANPSTHPTMAPSTEPSVAPTHIPSATPTAEPSVTPSQVPTAIPSEVPSMNPSQIPTYIPSEVPSVIPTYIPSEIPTDSPTKRPTRIPTHFPTSQPSTRPSSFPSSQPVALPTSCPSSQPVAHPTSQPTRQPTSHPSRQPFAHPTRQPTSQPSRNPSSQPTQQPSSHPSNRPTAQPSQQPSSQPTAYPSSIPTIIPSSQPTSRPSSYPSDMPSDSPSEHPTSCPTSQPTSIPTSAPSTIPSSRPSGQPTILPSSEPSSQPSCVPSSFPSTIPSIAPTCQPSSQPSSQPTSVPTSSKPTTNPSSVPSAYPNSHPTSKPTSYPSSIPSSQPTCIPSVWPSSQPSTRPSSYPTSFPTSQPSTQPSAQPTDTPTLTPSGVPTIFPSAQPSVMPSTSPSSQPSAQPSSAPSTFDSNRVFTCGKQLACESNNFQNCTFFTGNITIKCIPLQECVFQVGWFTVGPNTHINVLGNCEMSVIATNAISILNGSSITGSFLSFQSKTNIFIDGEIISDALGEEIGAGSPTVYTHGIGGSYGGNGGRPYCKNETFTNSFQQIGSVKIYPDFIYQYESVNPAIGSGGGPGSRGGGIIVLYSNHSVTLTSKAVLSAKGSPAPSHNVGGGSGGSVVIFTTNFSSSGVISVAGGDSNFATSGGGGGGRISITLAATKSLSTSMLNSLNVDGGVYLGPMLYDNITYRCLFGAPGTLFVEYTSLITSNPALSGTITVRNSRGKAYHPFAATVLSNLPDGIGRVYITGFSTLLSKSLLLQENKICSRSGPVSSLCSTIVVNNSTLVCANVTSVNDASEPGDNCHFRADSILFKDSQLLTSNDTSVEVTCRNFTLLPTSFIELSNSMKINSSSIVHLYGRVTQNHRSVENVSFQVYSTSNITLGNMSVSSVIISGKFISGNQITVAATNGSINPAYTFYFNQSYCQSGTSPSSFEPNSVIFNAHKLLKLNHSNIHASGISMCAYDLHILGDSVVRSDGLGAHVGQGIGAGQTYVTSGGGGGGFGGYGGTGQSPSLNGGHIYGSNLLTSYGSGGGCFNNISSACETGGQGGGYVNIHATNVELLGNITANGANGAADAGGGSGGHVFMLFETILGEGRILATGGNGGSGINPGGGGGGGYVTLSTYTAVRQDNTLNFDGTISTAGGSPGQIQSFGYEAGIYSAASGSSGVVELPNCVPGFGNVASAGRICVPCEIGYYSPGGDGSCLTCTNKPTHSTYSQGSWYNSECPYVCNAGYTTINCYDPFQEFLYDKIGLSGFIGSCFGFFALILLPLAYYRYRKIYHWGDKDKQNLNEDGKSRKAGRPGFPDESVDSIFATENPMFHAANEFNEKGEAKWMRIRRITHKSGKDGRREIRMVDQDMIFHAFRINLMGSNEPFSSRGGAWKLPLRRPDCLKPTLLAAEYCLFADKVNRLMAWNIFSFEMLAYFFILFITPPLSSYYMRHLRHMRTQRLLSFIASYDHSCFRCPIQRSLRNSLRVGVSPDSTLAYVDVLFDETHFTKSCKPLCPLGQTKLPAAFKFAGLGTYSTPFYIDTNDLLLQAVSQTDVVNAFIDEAWVTFVYNLNIHLRTLQCDAIYMGARSLMKYLNDPVTTKDLGGLVVQFCTFENEVSREEEDEALEKLEHAKEKKDQRKQKIADASQKAEENNLTSDKTKDIAEEDVDYPRDTFADMSRPSRSTRENWFHHVGDLLHNINPVVVGNSGKASIRIEDRVSEPEITMSEINKKTPTFKDSAPTVTVYTGSTGAALTGSKSTTMSNNQHAMDHGDDMPIRAPSPPPEPCLDRYCGCFAGITNFFIAWFMYCFSWCIKETKNENSTFRNKKKKKTSKTLKPLQSMDFIETCEGIRNGRLSMGIVVYHPKVIADTYVIQNEDYSSDLEDDDVLDETLIKDDSDDERATMNTSNVSESKQGGAKLLRRGISFDSDEEELFAHTKRVNFGTSSVTGGSEVQELSMSLGGSSISASLLKNYGVKADQMAKFYKIMMDAENGGGSESSAASSFVPSTPISFTPGSSLSMSMKGTSFSENRATVLSPSLFPFPMVSSRNPSFSGNYSQPPSGAMNSSLTSAFNPSTLPTSTEHITSPTFSTHSKRLVADTTSATASQQEGYTEFLSRSSSKNKGLASASFQENEDMNNAGDVEDTEVEDRPIQVEEDHGYATEDKEHRFLATRKLPMKPAVRSYSVFNPRSSFDSNENMDEDDENEDEGEDDEGNEEENSREGSFNSADSRNDRNNKRSKRRRWKTKNRPSDTTDISMNESSVQDGVDEDGNNEEDKDHDNSNVSPSQRIKSSRMSRRLLQEVGHNFKLEDEPVPDENEITRNTRLNTSKNDDEGHLKHSRYSEVSDGALNRDTFDSGSGRFLQQTYNRKKPSQPRAKSTKIKSAEDLLAEHQAELRLLRRKRRQQALQLRQRNDLAPSCFQHPIRAWVYSNIKLQGAYSPGKLGYVDPQYTDGLQVVNSPFHHTDEELGLSKNNSHNSLRATFDISNDPDDEDYCDQDGNYYDEEGGTSSRRSSVGSQQSSLRHHKQSKRHNRKQKSKQKNKKILSKQENPLETDSNERFRDSILPASFFSRMTFTGKGTHNKPHHDDDQDRKSGMFGGDEETGRFSWGIFGTRSSMTMMNDSNNIAKDLGSHDQSRHKAKGMTAIEALTNQENRRKQQQHPQLTLTNTTDTAYPEISTSKSPKEPTFWSDMNDSFRARWRLAYINNFYFFFFTRFMVGSNIFPYGPSYIRRVIELCLFVLSLSDCLLWVLILLTSVCVSNDATQCSNHLAFNLMISLWPGAFIIAPISGMIAIVLGPSSTLSRIYAMFSRLASINNIVLIVVVIQYSTYYFSVDQFSIWPVVALTSGRLFQTFMVDLYIAHIEKLRYTRGWDGMHTSLFKTRDNKVVINS